MEILGDDEAALPGAPPRRGPPTTERHETLPFGAVVDVTPPLPDAGADGVAPDHVDHLVGDERAQATSRLRALVDTVAGPEALGICGVLTALAGATTSALSPLALAFRPEFLGGPGTPASTAEAFATMLAVFGGVALAFGVGGVLRLRPASPAWVRGVSGSAAVLGLLLLVVSAWAIWRAGSLPDAFDVTGQT